jgi:hypothetical protein
MSYIHQNTFNAENAEIAKKKLQELCFSRFSSAGLAFSALNGLGVQAMEHTRKWNRLAHVL